MEIVPNSSGEGSTCDEEMSQEIPLQAGNKINEFGIFQASSFM